MRRWLTDPWRKPRLLEALVWGYLAWSILPVAIAVWFSFNAGRSAPAGRASRCAGTGRTRCCRSGTTRPAAGPAAQPAPGRAHHPGRRAPRGRLRHRPGPLAGPAGRRLQLQMLLSFVLSRSSWAWPCCSCSPTCSRRSSSAPGPSSWAWSPSSSYPVIICRARLLSIGSEYEEAAMDLGASPSGRSRTRPAAPAVPGRLRQRRARLRRRHRRLGARPKPVGRRRLRAHVGEDLQHGQGQPHPGPQRPGHHHAGLLLLAIALGFFVYRRLTQGERSRESTVEGFAAQI